MWFRSHQRSPLLIIGNFPIRISLFQQPTRSTSDISPIEEMSESASKVFTSDLTTFWIFGMEFKLEKSGRLNGWLSYTYARAFRRHASLDNKWFPTTFDKPHVLSISSNYEINKKVSLSSSFIFNSGRTITLPESGFYINNQLFINYSERNSGRIPIYHRLDVSLQIKNSIRRRKYESSWTFSIFNIYGKRNPYSVYTDKLLNDRFPQGYKLSILGSAFPSISYNFKFK